MTRPPVFLVLLSLLALTVGLPRLASAQPQHSFSIALGAQMPGAELRSHMRGRPIVEVTYGYRPLANVQIESGLTAGVGAAGVDADDATPAGVGRRSDTELFWSSGLRMGVPFRRVEFCAGAGIALMSYFEEVNVEVVVEPSTADYVASALLGGGWSTARRETRTMDCPTCRSRMGWAHYGLVGATLDVGHGAVGRVRLGVTVSLIRGHTAGEGLGSLPAGRSRDRWVKTTFDMAVQF